MQLNQVEFWRGAGGIASVATSGGGMRTEHNWIYFESGELPRDVTLQGVANLVAPHFDGDNHMHHYMIRGPKERLVLLYSPQTSFEEGIGNPYPSLNGRGSADDLFFEAEDDEEWYGEATSSVQQPGTATPLAKNTGRNPNRVNAWKILNDLRAERGLPKAMRPSTRTKVTRADIQKICVQVWNDKYPRALSDADFVLGELTAKLVEQEVERRVAILRGELIPMKGQ